MRLLFITIALACITLYSSLSKASPQIYPSSVEYRGAGVLSSTVTLFGVEEIASVDLVYVRDLTQAIEDDIKLGSFRLGVNQSRNIPIKLHVKTPVTFYICARDLSQAFPVRTCTKFQPKGN